MLLGGRVGVQVWALPLASCLQATVMICDVAYSGPVVLLNGALLDTPAEGASIAWALALIAEGHTGFYVLCAD